MERVIFHCNDRPLDAPAGHNLVARLQSPQHLLPFFLLRLLRTDQQQVEDGEDENEGQETIQSAHATGGLGQQGGRVVHNMCRVPDEQSFLFTFGASARTSLGGEGLAALILLSCHYGKVCVTAAPDLGLSLPSATAPLAAIRRVPQAL